MKPFPSTQWAFVALLLPTLALPVMGQASVNATAVPNEIDDDSCHPFLAPRYAYSGCHTCAPTTQFRWLRAVYLITAPECGVGGLVNGAVLQAIGWDLAYSRPDTASAPLTIYLQNTADQTNTKSGAWATAIADMQVVHSAITTLPSTSGPFDITLVGGTPFTYTGGALYVAIDWGEYTGPLVPYGGASGDRFALVNGLKSGSSTTPTAPTTIVPSSPRPTTRFTAPFANDVAVGRPLTYGSVPLGLTPVTVRAVVTNRGTEPQTNVPVTLTVTGVDEFTDTQTIPTLASCGGQTTVTFASFVPSGLGTDVLTVDAPGDDYNANSSKSENLYITSPDYSYKLPDWAPTAGFGLSGTGAIVGKFSTTAPIRVRQAMLEFFANDDNSDNRPRYRVAIYGDGGTGTPGAPLYEDTADRIVSDGGPVTITLPSPVPVGPGDFFVGIQQTTAIQAALSYDEEAPIRPSSFFLANQLPATTWIDFFPGMDAKPNIGVTIDRCDTPTLSVATVGSGSVTRDPDQASYGCDTPVTLTAVPDPGWHFVAWSGDAAGSDNPLSVVMNGDKSITATFGNVLSIDDPGASTDFALTRITPNPTADAAVIEYVVAREARVKLTVVDLQGRTVAVLHDGVKAAGRHQVSWTTSRSAGRLAAGVYFVRYEAAGTVMTKRLLLTR